MIDKSKKTIIFDFGNVLINLDFDRCFAIFEDVLNVDWSDRNLPESITNAIHKYDRGQISDEALIWAFQNLNPSANPRDIIKAWNSLIDIMPAERFTLLEQLSENYNLCILSNINSLHINTIRKYFKETYNLIDFEDRYFNQVFYSHLIGKRKPDLEVYQYVTEVLDVDKNDLLFIDDMKINIEAAQNFGWHGALHRPGEEIIDKIDHYLTQARFK